VNVNKYDIVVIATVLRKTEEWTQKCSHALQWRTEIMWQV